MIGTRIGSYEILEDIGKSGMAPAQVEAGLETGRRFDLESVLREIEAKDGG